MTVPTLTGLTTSLTFAENTVNGAWRHLDADVTFTDPDNNYFGGLLRIQGLLPEDQITILSEGTGPGQISFDGASIRFGGVLINQFSSESPGSVPGTRDKGFSFLGTATAAAIEALIENLIYSNTSDTPTVNRTITIVVTDAAGDSVSVPIAINVTPENDAPVLTGVASAVTFLENDANATPQLLDADVTFTDAENNFDGGTLTVTGLLAEDLVSLRDQGTGAGQIGFSAGTVTFGGSAIGTVSGGNGTTLTVTFNAAATSVAIDALIQNLTYANSSDTPTAARTLHIKVTDAAGDVTLSPLNLVQLPGASNPFNGITSFLDTHPTFGDLDGDGDLDMFAGIQNGSVLYFLNTGSASAPVFVQQTGVANPLNGIDVGEQATPTLVDLNGDGKLDVVVGMFDGWVRYFLNTGTSSVPAFAEQTGAANPLDAAHSYSRSVPAFVDLDDDGDFDMALGDSFGSLYYFENTGTATAPAFVARTGAANPLNGINVGVESKPSFGDADGDGDIDILVANGLGQVHYLENISTTETPSFAAASYLNIDVGYNAAAALVDLDGDGDLDVVIGRNAGGIVTYESMVADGVPIVVNVTAENDAPQLSDVTSTLTFLENTVNAAPQLLDADVTLTDAEGNFDGGTLVVSGLLVEDLVSLRNQGTNVGQIGINAGSVTFGGTAIGTVTGGNGTTLTINFNASATVAAIEALIQNLTYSNASDTPTANRTFTIAVTDAELASTSRQIAVNVTAQNDAPQLSDVTSTVTFLENAVNAAPQLLDADVTLTDAEGNFDGGTLVVSGQLAEDTVAIRNQGTGAGQIGFSGGTVTYSGTAIGTMAGGVGGALTVTFNAGATSAAVDAVIQNLTYANSSDTPTDSRTLHIKVMDAAGDSMVSPFDPVPLSDASNPFNGIVNFFDTIPTFGDLDGDGDLDALVGTQDGSVAYYRNTGTASAPVFVQQTGAANPLDGIDFGEESAPCIVDLNGDGALDVVVGALDGELRYFLNTGTTSAPSLAEQSGIANPLDTINVFARSSPAFADLDGDGDLDMALGHNDGSVLYFENTGTATAPTFVARTGAANPFDGIDLGFESTVSLGDLDGDGDVDLIVGNRLGELFYFENTGTVSTPSLAAGASLNIDVGFASAPALADLDGDGDLDVVVGGNAVGLITFENSVADGIAIVVNVTAESDIGNTILGTRRGDIIGASSTVRGQPLPTDNADTIFGGNGNDDISGLGDNDTINGGNGHDVLRGGAGNDIIQVAGAQGKRDIIDGGSGLDTLQAIGNAAVTLAGFDAAASSIEVWLGNGKAVLGTGSADVFDFSGMTSISGLLYVDGGKGNDTLTGSDFADDLRGGNGHDTIEGGDGQDTITGGRGNDILRGGADDDLFLVSGGQATFDTFDGGSGTDTLQVIGNGSATLAGFDAATSSIEAWLGNGKALMGTGAADTFDFSGLTSVSGLRYVNGGRGNDTLIGSSFADDLRGGHDNDRLDGGAGDDLLLGGNGRDTFVFADGYGSDTVLDYKAGQDIFDFTGVSGVHAFSDLFLTQVDAKTVLIDFDGVVGGDTVTVEKMTTAILLANQGDFLFA